MFYGFNKQIASFAASKIISIFICKKIEIIIYLKKTIIISNSLSLSMRRLMQLAKASMLYVF